jgi:hypothetical protein
MTATTTKAKAKTAKAATAAPPAVTAEVLPTEAPAAAEATAAPQPAIVPAAEAQAISRWEAIACDIAIAEGEAPGKVFDYDDKWDNRQARSWVYELRQLKGKIERARKDAKAVHLQRGKTVDETAKTLEAAVQGLIEPHETAIKAIEAREEARIEAHRAVLDRIAALVEGVEFAAEASARIVELLAIDTTTLEEFSEAGANRCAEALERLQTLHDTLAAQEAERIELEALRAEKAAREESDRIAQLQREAVEADRLAREAQAQAQVEAARVKQQAEMEAELREAAARAEEAKQQRRDDFVAALTATLTTMDPGTAARAIAEGTLHPAVQVDWSEV